MRTQTTTPRKPRIKAPSPVLSRCEIGKNILHVRAQAVKAAKDIDEFYVVEGKGWKKYCNHVAKCDCCKAYEEQKHAKQMERFDNKLSSESNLNS